ncbi:hypothetical protein ACQEU6_46270 [Spirillospora sp. CA-108201]
MATRGARPGGRPVRRRERSAARRAAWHAERLQRARTAEERLAAAAAFLTSAAAHARGAGAAKQAAAEVAEHARQVMGRAALPEASRRLHEAKLTAGGTEAARLSSALMVLRSAIARLPESDRDRLRDFYAGELAAEAARIGGGR